MKYFNLVDNSFVCISDMVYQIAFSLQLMRKFCVNVVVFHFSTQWHTTTSRGSAPEKVCSAWTSSSATSGATLTSWTQTGRKNCAILRARIKWVKFSYVGGLLFVVHYKIDFKIWYFSWNPNDMNGLYSL